MKLLSFSATTLVAIMGLPGLAWADAPGGGNAPYGYGHPHMWGDGWTGMIFGPLMMILFIAVIVVLAVLAVRWLGGAAQPPATPQGRTPLDILKDRFARGEIDEEEFERRRRVLAD